MVRKRTRYYLTQMNIEDAWVWFIYRSKMKNTAKLSQKNICEGTKTLKGILNMSTTRKHSKFWRRMSKKLKELEKIKEKEEKKQK